MFSIWLSEWVAHALIVHREMKNSKCPYKNESDLQFLVFRVLHLGYAYRHTCINIECHSTWNISAASNKYSKNFSVFCDCDERCTKFILFAAPAPYDSYWSQNNIENYLLKTNLPAMSELTACFYYGPNHLVPPKIDGSYPYIQAIISVASTSKTLCCCICFAM